MKSTDSGSATFSHILSSTGKSVLAGCTIFRGTVSRKETVSGKRHSSLKLEFANYIWNLESEREMRPSTTVSKMVRTKIFTKWEIEGVEIKVRELTYKQWLDLWNGETLWQLSPGKVQEPIFETIEDLQRTSGLCDPLLIVDPMTPPSCGVRRGQGNPPKLIRKTRMPFGGARPVLRPRLQLDTADKKQSSSMILNEDGSPMVCSCDSSTGIRCTCLPWVRPNPMHVIEPSSPPITIQRTGTPTSWGEDPSCDA